MDTSDRRCAVTRRMKTILGGVTLLVLLLTFGHGCQPAFVDRATTRGRDTSAPRVDVVFILDATASMRDEIQDVKTNIISIGSRLAVRKPAPDIRFGAVFYRDLPSRGIPEGRLVDVVPLSHDLNAVQQEILDVPVLGNRDWPEHVGIGLHKALEMNWSHSEGATRLLYLIGDAPPQDHEDGYDVHSAVDKAKAMGVKIHAIGCSGIEGGPSQFHGPLNGIESFTEIAEATGGTFSLFDRKQYQQRQQSTDYLRRPPTQLSDLLAPKSDGHWNSAPRNADERKIDGPVIGIDLGTKESCVGIYKNGRVEIIPNAQGNRQTPSYVRFSEDQVLVGDEAQGLAASGQAVFDVKRLIGRSFNDEQLQRDLKILPYSVIDVNGRPHINLTVDKGPTILRPEDVAAKVLASLKQAAENHLGKNVRHAVITVPAEFNDAQRQATKDAATIAGLSVLRIINEPTAAAIAYGLDKHTEENILVYHLGGSSLQVSLLTIDNGVFEVVATAGNTHLGGADIDDRIIEYFREKLDASYNVDVSENTRAMHKLRSEARKAKHALSSATTVDVTFEALHKGRDFSISLTRARLESLVSGLINQTLPAIQQVLAESGLNKNQVDRIVLAGGATKVTKVRSVVEDFFDGKLSQKGIDAAEAAAYGAATQAGILSGEGGQDLLLLDVTPLTLGFEAPGGAMTPVIMRNSVIPTKRAQLISTWENSDSEMRIRVYEGERPLVKDNRFVGGLNISGIPVGRRGDSQIELTFEIDSNGLLSVGADVKGTNVSHRSVFYGDDANMLTEETIERMIKDAENFASEDAAANEQRWARTALSEYLTTVTAAAEASSVGDDFSDEERQVILEAKNNGTRWLLSTFEATADEIKATLRDMEAACGKIVEHHKAEIERWRVRTALSEYLTSMKSAVDGSRSIGRLSELLEDGEKDRLLSRVRDATEWLIASPHATVHEMTTTQDEVYAACRPILQKYDAVLGAGGSSVESGSTTTDMPEILSEILYKSIHDEI